MQTYFVEKIKQNAENHPDRLSLAMDFGQEPVSFSELWEQSGKIYALLKNKDIGRENFVMLLLPRSPKMFIAMLGVLRAGAAFVFMENSYPEKRIRLIHEDLKVKFTLNLAAYEEAMQYSSLPGYEQTDPHDACCSFSTSGTTGKPKTMIQEYGKLDVCLDSWFADVADLHEEDPQNFGMIFPFNFAAAFVLPLPKLYAADSIYIMSYDVVRNLVRFEEFLESEHITEIYLSPSFIRTYKGGYHYIKKVIAAGEPATGIYKEGLDVYAYYGMSETCFMVSSFLLDKACDKVVVGKNNFGLRIMILDDNGNSVPRGETGEICFDNPYFRGYLNLPELNEDIHRYGIFHSNDLGYIDENNNLVIRGRIDDMVKINGNRVEPLEIEHVVRKELCIEHPVARVVKINDRSFIVLYYLENEKVPLIDNPVEVGKILSKNLPSYMIPTYYMGIDAFPTNANGKLSKKMLPVPDINEFRSSYSKPENESESVFCKAMAEVLGLKRVGADEDFFLIGGDSLSAMRMITACAEEGYLVTVNGLFECRTAKNLAVRFGHGKVKSNAELLEANKKALQKSAELTAGQLFQLEMAVNQKKPQIITYHVAMVFGLRPEVDTEKLITASEKVIRNHPVFLSAFRNCDDGIIRQFYDKNLFTPVETVFMTDEEFTAKKPLLPQPMDPFGGKLYRCCLISTPSKNYFFYDFHHLIADEMSSSIFVREVAACYFDTDFVQPSDWLYLVQQTGRKSDTSESAAKLNAYLEKLKSKTTCTGRGILKPDLPGPETGTGVFFVPDAFRRNGTYSNRLFLTACAMATARMNGEETALIYANYHGRDDFLKNDSITCYVTPVPVILDCRKGRSAEEMMNDIRTQFDFGAAHCDYAHILEHRDVLQNTVMFNYRNGTMNIGRFADLCNEVYLCPKPANQPNCLVISGIVGQPGSDNLGFYCTYPKGIYSEKAIRRFYNEFVTAVHQLSGEEAL